MTLSKDNRPGRPQQTRTQKIVMWSIFGVAAAMAVAAIVIFFVSGARLF
ncbi:MAG: hypothetical protein ACYCZY_04165 [Lacisediminihabitans sp.]